MRIYCEICTELFDETKDVASTLCGHIFHESCIQKWLKYSRTCPKCRNPVEEAHTIRLFFSVFASQAETNEYLENEVNSLKALVRSKDLEIIKRRTAEAEVKSRILEVKLRAMRLEQRVNNIQLKHMKVLMITTHWCQSLKNALENLISATRIMRNVWERNSLRQRKIETEILKKAQELEASQYVPLACNDCLRNTRSRNSAMENIASNLPSDIRRRLLEIKVLKDTQAFEATQNISPTYNLCSRNTRCRNSDNANMAPNLNISSILSDHIVLSNRCRRSYNPYGYTRSRNIFIRRDEEFSRLSEMPGPGTSSMGISTHSGRISAIRQHEDYEVINASTMDQN